MPSIGDDANTEKKKKKKKKERMKMETDLSNRFYDIISSAFVVDLDALEEKYKHMKNKNVNDDHYNKNKINNMKDVNPKEMEIIENVTSTNFRQGIAAGIGTLFVLRCCRRFVYPYLTNMYYRMNARSKPVWQLERGIQKDLQQQQQQQQQQQLQQQQQNQQSHVFESPFIESVSKQQLQQQQQLSSVGSNVVEQSVVSSTTTNSSSSGSGSSNSTNSSNSSSRLETIAGIFAGAFFWIVDIIVSGVVATNVATYFGYKDIEYKLSELSKIPLVEGQSPISNLVCPNLVSEYKKLLNPEISSSPKMDSTASILTTISSESALASASSSLSSLGYNDGNDNVDTDTRRLRLQKECMDHPESVFLKGMIELSKNCEKRMAYEQFLLRQQHYDDDNEDDYENHPPIPSPGVPEDYPLG